MREIEKSKIYNLLDVPWGTHLCQFYRTKEELLEILIPYLEIGLKNNEFCTWITSDFFNEEDAIKAIIRAFPNIRKYLKIIQIKIIPYKKCFKYGASDMKKVIDVWLHEINRALEDDFNGARIIVDTAWLKKGVREKFTELEEEISKVIGKYRIRAICCYLITKCDASQVRNVVHSHEMALIKRNNEWTVIKSSKSDREKKVTEHCEGEKRETLESIPDTIKIPYYDDKITDCAQAILDLTGYSSKSVMADEGSSDLISKNKEEKNQRKPKKSSDLSFGRSFEHAYMKTGKRQLSSSLPFSGTFNPYQKYLGNILGTNEQTQLKQFEEKMVQSGKLAEIGTFASGIAHGINNPLAGIMGYAEIIIDEKNPKQMKKYAKKIVGEAERASDLVKWISRYSKQAKDNDITNVDLIKVINESLEALNHTWKSSDIEIIKKYQKTPNIKGNPSELQQVFVNIIDNAMDAMRKGGKLNLSTAISNGCVEVKISDSGVGIPNENLKKIFKPFFTTKKEGKGIGLGLYVTSLIVKKHHGKIEVDSELGKGTIFTLRFPISVKKKR